jgi:hypothetical protein
MHHNPFAAANAQKHIVSVRQRTDGRPQLAPNGLIQLVGKFHYMAATYSVSFSSLH